MLGIQDPYCSMGNKSRTNGVEDVRDWPEVAYPDIYNYLIETHSGKSLKAYKSLNRYNYYINGWVSNVVASSFVPPSSHS